MPTTRTFIFVTMLLSLAVPTTQAQVAESAPPPVDLTLLKHALSPLASHGLLQSHSTLQMTGSHQGISFTFHERLNVTAKHSGKFRAEILQFTAGGVPQARLLVVSNGVQVWTYRPGTHQYSIKTAKAFHSANDDMIATGLAVGGFFLGDGHDLAQGLQRMSRQNNSQMLSALSGMGIKVSEIKASERTEGTNGEDDFVYRLVLSKQGLTYQFVINPKTNALREVELNGQQNGVTMAFRENVSALNCPGTVSKNTFAFAVPPDTDRLPTLSVNPF